MKKKQPQAEGGSIMKEEQKAKLEALAERTLQWGKQTFTPRRMKKAVGVVLVLAVAGAGGKFALHRVKGAARLQEAQARSNLLQNLAASQNITLLTTEAVKDKVAQALGTTPDAVTFKNVILADKGPKEFQGPKDKDHNFKKERKDDNKHRDKKENRDDRFDHTRAPQPPVNGQQPIAAPQPDRQAMAAAPGLPAALPAAPGPHAEPHFAGASKNNGFPAFYLADCEMGGMRYHFVIDAQSGKILRSQVHKEGLLDSFLA